MDKDRIGILDRIRLVKDMKLPSRDDLLATLKRSAGRVPFADDVVAMWYCATDRATPSKVRVSIIGALAYLVLPADAIPDLLIGIGFSDDITVVAAVLAMVTSHIKPEHREKARAAFSAEGSESDEDMPIRPID